MMFGTKTKGDNPLVVGACIRAWDRRHVGWFDRRFLDAYDGCTVTPFEFVRVAEGFVKSNLFIVCPR